MISGYLSFIGDHLWQSTLFAAVVYMLTLTLRENRAAIRYRLWVAASVKFLVPFALVISIGRQAEWAADQVEPPATLVYAVEGISQPFAFGQPFSSQSTRVSLEMTPAAPMPAAENAQTAA